MNAISKSRDKIYGKLILSEAISDYTNFASQELAFYEWLRSDQINYLRANFSEAIRRLVEEKFQILYTLMSQNKIEDVRASLGIYHGFDIPYKYDLSGIFLEKISDKNIQKQNFRKLIFIFSNSSFFSEFQSQIGSLHAKDLFILVNELVWSGQQRDNIENLKITKDTKYAESFLSFIENTTSMIENKSYDLIKIHDKYIKQFNDDNLRRKRRIKSLSSMFKIESRKVQREIALGRKDFEDLKASFIDYMHMKAPAEYWQKRADQANTARLVYAFSFALLIAGLGWLFVGFVVPWLKPFVEQMSKADKYPVFEVSILISLSAFSFWLLRLFARLALSSHHLKIDADERNVMIQTYLALIKEGGASEQERNIILQTIFKPTSDGIVKEDPQIDLPIANLIRGKGLVN